jgi:serine/threonine protein kinase
MGEVYRARDTKLNRDVAIKVLLPAVATDPERMARFSREAQLLASLNHSNIGSIYGLEGARGDQALVMELVEGPTLADRIAKGPLAVREALAVATQIADGLEVAHERGIIHRDLKPANIKIRPDGTVKVLDFGLAKALTPEGPSNDDPMNSPTLSDHATEAGLILGTAAYMAPEQARGMEADRRADIWAFGCVLFEMLTGRRAFGGQTSSDSLAAVLEREPDWRSLPAATPVAVRRLLRRCLEKDAKRRLRDISDARIELTDAAEHRALDEPETKRAPRSFVRERLLWFAALVVTVLIAAWFGASAFRPRAPLPELRVDIATPPTTDRMSVAISPDGRKIVFVASADGRPQLWIRRLDTATAEPLPGTNSASWPFWSADSRSIGFFADGTLKRLDVDGGAVTELASAPNGQGGAWNASGVILFAPVPASPLLAVSASGGKPAAATTVAGPKQVGHEFPHFLPDGRHFIFHVQGAPDAAGVYVAQLGSAETKRLVEAASAAVYTSGHLLFVRNEKLLAQDFDTQTLSMSGDPFEIASGVAVRQVSAGLSASVSGAIVYRRGASGQRLEWFDGSGKELGPVGNGDIDALTGPALSRDGRRFAVFLRERGNTDIWLLDADRGGLTRFTDDTADDIFPVWSPDGSRIVFSSTRGKKLDLYLKAVGGTAAEQLLFESPEIKAASDWSPDGRFVLYSASAATGDFDIWAIPVHGDRRPFPVVQAKSNDRLGQFSKDGKWIAFESNESGRYEVYVQPFPADGRSGSKVPVTTKGGAQARWKQDGKALYYIALDGQLMEVPIRFAADGRSVEPGVPVPRFMSKTPGGAVQPFPRNQYTPYPDGRFAMVVEARDLVTAPLTLLLNWSAKKP